MSQMLNVQQDRPSFVQHSAVSSGRYVQNDPLDVRMPAAVGALYNSPGGAHGGRNTTMISSVGDGDHGSKQPIHVQLIEKGRLYEQRKEALQERAIRDQLKEAGHNPTVSGLAKNLKRDEVPWKRFQRLEQARRERHNEKVREAVAAQAKEQAHEFTPKISRKGRRATGKISGMKEYNDTWMQRREEKLEAARTKKIIQEMAGVRDAPDINDRSNRIAERRKDREGMASLSHVDTLLERDRVSKLAAWEKSQRQLMESMQSTPKITAYAANIYRGGSNVGERLYMNSFEAEEKKALRMHQKSGGDHTYSPRISRYASSVRREQPVEEEIMERYERSQMVKEERIQRILKAERDSHVPAINPVSDEIASRLPETARERLSKPKLQYFDPVSDSAFQPGTTPRSRGHSEDGTRSPSASQRYNQLFHQEEKRREKLRVLREKQEEAALEGCTFHPKLHRSNSGNSRSHELSVHERSAQWQRRREQKLEDTRKSLVESEVGKCTFQPALNRNDPDGVKSVTSSTGYEEFIERQREARRRQEQMEQAHASGHRWTGRPTTPQEFHLGRASQGGQGIKSLERPIPAGQRVEEDFFRSPEYQKWEQDRSGQRMPSGATADTFSQHASFANNSLGGPTGTTPVYKSLRD